FRACFRPRAGIPACSGLRQLEGLCRQAFLARAKRDPNEPEPPFWRNVVRRVQQNVTQFLEGRGTINHEGRAKELLWRQASPYGCWDLSEADRKSTRLNSS